MTSSDYAAIDLFAGPGGWDVAARDLGIDVLGLELDAQTCATRRAAGLPTIEGDVRDYGAAFLLRSDVGTLARGLIASPPCPTFSVAGKLSGRCDWDACLVAVTALQARQAVDWSIFEDARTGLVGEPLRYALEAKDLGRPFEWLAFEQVPAVLPVWELLAEVLRDEGYSVDVGVLNAVRFGVPQTRRRAILVARRDREVRLPEPTHRAFKKGVAQADGDAGLLPWRSQADALGWEDGLVGFPRRADPPKPSVVLNGVEYRARDFRATDEPAFAMTEKVRSWSRWRGDAPPVSVEECEASALQTFPADYPWQGSRTSRFLQIGNAIPPTLARAVLASVAD